MKQSKTMELKKPVRVSLARQVLTAMESMIRSGKWKVGDRIPAEAELARAFSVSHNTIREALQSLIHMGMPSAHGSLPALNAASSIRLGVLVFTPAQKPPRG